MTTNTTTTTATTTTTTTAISGKPASASAEDKRPKEIRLPKLTDPVRDKSLRMIHDALAGKEGDIEPSQGTVGGGVICHISLGMLNFKLRNRSCCSFNRGSYI